MGYDGALSRLGVSPEDAAEVLRTIPSEERDPAAWARIEEGREALAQERPPGSSGKLFPVHVILAALGDIRQRHQQFGIPDDISWETLAFVGRAMAAYRARHGEAGIELSHWAWLRYTGRLYQVGRLEVTPYLLRTHPKEAGPLFWYDDNTAERMGSGFRRGDPAVGLHVPPGEPLSPDACDESLRRMRGAFSGVYPGKPLRVGTCTAWMLDEQLAEYLPEHSNIVAFQRRFTIVPGAREADEAVLHNVFGTGRPADLAALPQTTTLQQAVVRHLQQGRHWCMRTGWLAIGEDGGVDDQRD